MEGEGKSDKGEEKARERVGVPWTGDVSCKKPPPLPKPDPCYECEKSEAEVTVTLTPQKDVADPVEVGMCLDCVDKMVKALEGSIRESASESGCDSLK